MPQCLDAVYSIKMNHPPSHDHGPMPLEPIERPRGLFVRFLFAYSRVVYGKVIGPIKVLYARFPAAAWIGALHMQIVRWSLTIGADLYILIDVKMATQNGCTFCADLAQAEAVKHKVGRQRFAVLHEYETSTLFSDPEKAALAYCDALGQSFDIDDAVFARLRQHFSQRQVAEIVWTCSMCLYYNSMAHPLRIGSDHLTKG